MSAAAVDSAIVVSTAAVGSAISVSTVAAADEVAAATAAAPSVALLSGAAAPSAAWGSSGAVDEAAAVSVFTDVVDIAAACMVAKHGAALASNASAASARDCSLSMRSLWPKPMVAASASISTRAASVVRPVTGCIQIH